MRLKSKLKKLFFAYCPKPLLHRLVRRMVDVTYDHDPRLVVKIAETKEELEGAFQVLYRSYLEMGYCDKTESEMRLTIHHALPTTSVIIAKYDDRVVGTMTLVRNNNLKLPCEKLWDISFLKRNGRRVAEITCLAIDKEFRRAKNGNIFFPILKFMYEFTTELFGTQVLAVIVHPKEQFFYEGLLFFKKITDEVVADYYGAPAMGLYLDLVEAPEVFRACYNSKPTKNNLYHYMTQFASKNFVMPKKNSYSVDFPVMNKDLFRYFFFEKSNIGPTVDGETLQQILLHYPNREKSGRIASRFNVDINGLILDPITATKQDVVIKNISTTGLRIATASDQSLNLITQKTYQVLFTHNNSIFEMTVTNQWLKSGSQAGFTVNSNQLNWYRFLKSINYNYASQEDVRDAFTQDSPKVSAS